ncbi:hypothetical protein PLICBS_000665 [Purpureocillium lilacinum]|uniref:uncharacterized protein n=1 Tax=Purpureocillium lilacinum TaxID=33203 RepID=UPI00208663D7|nr:hypothetical protein PLICBS_000665 [Purpureocillium lilacinum]
MAPSSSSQTGAVYRDLIQSNCQTYLGPRVEFDVVSQLDATGTLWTVHVLRLRGGGKRRASVLSGSAGTLEAALEELHKKSAQAVDQHVARNGFGAAKSASKRSSKKTLSSKRTSRSSRARHGLRDLDDDSDSGSDSDASTESVCSSWESGSEASSGSSGSDSLIDGPSPPGPKPWAHVDVRPGWPLQQHGMRQNPHMHSMHSRHVGPSPWSANKVPPMPTPGFNAGACPPPPLTVTQTKPTPGGMGFPRQGGMPMPPPIPSQFGHQQQQQQQNKPPQGIVPQGMRQRRSPVFPVGPPTYMPKSYAGQAPPPPPPASSRPTPTTSQTLGEKTTVLLTISWGRHGTASFINQCELSVSALRKMTRELLRLKSDSFPEHPEFWPPPKDELDKLDVEITKILLGSQVYHVGSTAQDDMSVLLSLPSPSKSGSASDVPHVFVEVAESEPAIILVD